MKVGIIGGLMMGGFLSMALVGLMPGLCLLIVGGLLASAGVIQEHKEEQKANNWRKTYPTYKY